MINLDQNVSLGTEVITVLNPSESTAAQLSAHCVHGNAAAVATAQ